MSPPGPGGSTAVATSSKGGTASIAGAGVPGQAGLSAVGGGAGLVAAGGLVTTAGTAGTGAAAVAGLAGLSAGGLSANLSGGAPMGGASPGGAVPTGGAATGGQGTGGVMPGGSSAGGTSSGATGGTSGATGGVATSGGGMLSAGAGGQGAVGSGGEATGGSGAASAGTSSTGGTDTAGTGPGGAGTGGGATGGTGGTLAGCTPGRLDETATCNYPAMMTGAPGDPADCVGTLSGRWGSLYVTIDGQQYFLQVNEWGSQAQQTMAYGGDFFFKMTVQQADTGTNGTGAPTGFPSMFIGSNSNHTTQNSNLPKPITELTSVATTWIWNDNGALADENANIFNATYDVWFNQNLQDQTRSGPTGGYLMVWLYDPPLAQPIGGEPAETGVTIEGVDGAWDIWIGKNGNLPCISYVRTEMTYQMSFDLNRFIQDAITRPNALESSWVLTNIFTGFEIWKGAQGVESTAFCAFVQ